MCELTERGLSGRRLRALRPPKPHHDPWQPLGVRIEVERLPGCLAPIGDSVGNAVEDQTENPVPAVTIFLAGAECPFTCVFCDLWRHTLPGTTPSGALPKQIEIALAQAISETDGELGDLSNATVKLYNASNFFEARAVPRDDLPVIARQLDEVARVVVECHPRLIGRDCFEFAGRLRGDLEVAMGLETIHPEALPRLNKSMVLDDWQRAAERLRREGIGIRAFVILGTPFVPADEAVEWAVRSVEWAIANGAGHVSIIPLRAGNGAVETLVADGQATVPHLAQLEDALERAVKAIGSQAVVTADLWDVDLLSSCQKCFEARRSRLEAINLGGTVPSPIECAHCSQESRPERVAGPS